MSRFLRAFVIAAYVIAFWLALPAGLWRLAVTIDRFLGLSWQRNALGWVVVLGGLVLMLSAIHALRRQGRGLPVSALPPPELTRRGPYRHVRHPIYLGFNLSLVGLGLALGSAALTLIVAPAFVAVWVVYALLEERVLLRRFGDRYRHYRRSVGILPRLPSCELTRLVARTQPINIEGAENLPRRGAAVLVANHCCYLDPVFIGMSTLRWIRFLATADVFRHPLLRLYANQRGAVPTRRYRTDVVACREMLRLLEDGELIGLFIEGERSVLGAYQGAQPQVARILPRLSCPVIPIGISGNYDLGPRWADTLRRRPLVIRVGPPVRWNGEEPAVVVDRALRALIDQDPQPVHLAGLPRERLACVLWRCPICSDEDGWSAFQLRCRTCGVQLEPTPDGAFNADGERFLFADLGRRVLAGAERDPLVLAADAWREASSHGAIRPLTPMGRGVLEIGSWGLSFQNLRVDLTQLRNVSTERADTLQIATRESMWQFRPHDGSVFRLAAMLERLRQAALERQVIAE